MKDFLVKVGDQFRVEERLREIDPSYEVFYNKKDKRFEVYSKRAGESFLAVVSPYSELDARLVSYVRKTRVERVKDIIKEVEENNEKIERKAVEEKEKIKQDKINELKKKLKG